MRLLDALRGFSLVSMVCFHLCYDLVYLYGVSIAWFRPPLQDIWRSSISWTFLLLAGIMCSLSRSNLKRAAKYGAFALAIWLITSIAAVDAPINFGIIYCMAFSTFVVWVLERCHAVPCGPLCALVFFVLFLFAYRIPQGYVGIGPATFAVPRALYEGNALSFLGFPGPTFFSSDYYPPLPFTLLYLSGCSLGRWWRKTGFPSALTVYGCVPLEFIGRHSLLVYAIHQPVLLGILYLAFG
ncbi:MAG: heparan-alpha-glucosaminide N-acetyltransferase [Coriobacteriales bacterium]|nr:heparan-alpha-glucosaminide N-acetyltransferase [Coriobacteriales bacterium]